MTERFNYTGRVIIEDHDVHIHLIHQGEAVWFKATIDFNNYQFPPDARVFIEAYRLTHLARFDFGTVGNFTAPASTSLAEFREEVPRVRYRVKVVASDERKTILGMPNRGRGKYADNAEGGGAVCLLPVNLLPEYSRQVWAVQIDDDGPHLGMNRKLDKMLLEKEEFIALVYPAALKEVLSYTFLLHHDGKGCKWADDWKQFAADNLDEPFPNIADWPEINEAYREAVSEWIEDVAESFSSEADFLGMVTGGWK